MSVSQYSTQTNRVGLPVEYLTSASSSSGACTLHFFQVSGRPGRDGRQSKRLVLLLDKEGYAADLQTSMERCIAISHIQTMVLYEDDVRAVKGAPNQYDLLFSAINAFDLVRLIASVYRPEDPVNEIPSFEMIENRPIAQKVYVRPSTVMHESNFSKVQGEEMLRRVRQDATTEIAQLREELRKEREAKSNELVDLQTRNNELQHRLEQTQLLMKMTNSKQAAPYTGFSESVPLGNTTAPPPIPKKGPPTAYQPTSGHPPMKNRTQVNIYSNGRTPMTYG
eukprot:TRINITY_DN15948_c0_g1_i2.p1 TRINITY_DN15948_c0_g1~~TRINITY_DN15948_c0_g1_i2.p1  ORF type:complete len:280 (+),score=52.95 TRINITY_DN15948_c0_g1_i2:51-890(+)